MSLATTKKVVRHCRALQNASIHHDSWAEVAKPLMAEFVHLHNSLIKSYDDYSKKIAKDNDPITRTKSLSLQLVKDRVFLDSLRARLFLKPAGIDNTNGINHLIQSVDDYVGEVSKRVFSGVPIDFVLMNNLVDDEAQDLTMDIWDQIANLRIKLTHTFDRLREDPSLDYECFRQDRLEELSARVRLLNAKFTSVKKNYNSLFQRAFV